MKHLLFMLPLLLSISAVAQTTRPVTVAIHQNNAECNITGLSETRTNFIYPNPASAIITIGSLRENSEIMLFDASGKRIRVDDLRVNTNQLNVRSLNDGLYLLKIKHTRDIEVIKIMVQHK